jgi:hypothetical protein
LWRVAEQEKVTSEQVDLSSAFPNKTRHERGVARENGELSEKTRVIDEWKVATAPE